MKSKLSKLSTILRHSVAFALIWSTADSGYACSAIAADPNAEPLLAGNYDWKARGGIVFTSPRGQIKEALSLSKKAKLAKWTSKYSSLTISQFGRDFPMQGINEAGLAGMVLVGEAQYPNQGPLGVIQENLWLQYQLDQFGSVAEVVEHVSDFGIEKLSASLHWFMCDKTRDCAVIEFIQGEAVVHRGSELYIRAVTNTAYQKAIQTLSHWRQSERPMPQGYESTHRFIRLAEASDIRDALRLAVTLDQVALSGYTAWQTIFDLESRSLVVRLEGAPWRTLNLVAELSQCGETFSMMDLADGIWKSYNHDRVAALFAEASKGTVGLGAERRDKILRSSESIRCDNLARGR
jgi:choloylglycine hydrolase